MQATVSRNLILHSDHGSQVTSKEFTEFCESVGITQGMSKAGYTYDNAPMERYFNTLKNELIYLHDYRQKMICTHLSMNLPIFSTTMCGRTHITDTRLRLKPEQELAIIKPQVLQKSLTTTILCYAIQREGSFFVLI